MRAVRFGGMETVERKRRAIIGRAGVVVRGWLAACRLLHVIVVFQVIGRQHKSWRQHPTGLFGAFGLNPGVIGAQEGATKSRARVAEQQHP